MSEDFIPRIPTLEDYWRGIILFGRNVASYKFALAKTLLELKPGAGSLLKLGDLAPTYAQHIASHLKGADKQGTFSSSKFLDACRGFNSGELSLNSLIDQTVRLGFNNVIDAFHVVRAAATPKRFFVDERQSSGGIRITDEFSELLAQGQAESFPQEVEARWRLVETAWELGMTRALIAIDYNAETELFFSLDGKRRRKQITSSRDCQFPPFLNTYYSISSSGCSSGS